MQATQCVVVETWTSAVKDRWSSWFSLSQQCCAGAWPQGTFAPLGDVHMQDEKWWEGDRLHRTPHQIVSLKGKITAP